MEKKKLLISLISGNTDSAQKADIFRELKSNKQLRDEYESIKNAWALSSFDQPMDPVKVERSYLSFNNKIKRKGNKVIIWNMLKYAAIIILFFSIGVLTKQYIFEDSISTFNKTAKLNQIMVPNEEKSELVLSDGSKVWLNEGTTLIFPVEFDGQSRTVTITGEAFFNVKKGQIPFIVSTEYGDINVLGTSFNVRAYDNMDFQATLEEGEIQFKSSIGERILTPGQQLVISKEHGWIIKKVNTENYSSWKSGVISFENEPLEEVMKKLERHFDIQINLDENIAPIRFTGKIFDESISEVINYINKTKPIEYAYDKNTRQLTIYGIN